MLTLVQSLGNKIPTTLVDHNTKPSNITKPKRKRRQRDRRRRTPPNRPDVADRNPVAANTKTSGSPYKAIYSTPSTVGSSIYQHLSPGQAPSPRLDDFPSLPVSDIPRVTPNPEVDGRRRAPKRTRFRGGRFPNPAVGDSKPPALLLRDAKSHPEVMKTIKEHMNPGEFNNNIHFNKSRKGELLIRFTNSQTIDEDLKKVRNQLSDMGPEAIRNVVTRGRLDHILILEVDPSTTEDEILEALRKTTPPKTREYIRINGLWKTSSGYDKALATVPREVFSAVRRVRVGFFLCRTRHSAPPLPGVTNTTISGTSPRRVKVPTSGAHAVGAQKVTPQRNAQRDRTYASHATGKAFPPSHISLAPPGVVPGWRRTIDPPSQ